jgi:hypothetical protein
LVIIGYETQSQTTFQTPSKGDHLKAKHQKRILLAVTREHIPTLSKVLEQDFELIFCSSLDQASAMLDESINLITCDTHFDDCRMFDLLRLSKADPVTRKIPFLCLRVVEGELDQTLYQSVDIASTALGAARFVDLFHLKRQCGEEDAHTKLRNLVDNLASSPDD